MARVTNKTILEKALQVRNEYNIELEKARKNERSWKGLVSGRGISWGRDKEIGNLYHAYCEFCHDIYEDGATYKSDCEQLARKKGWIIGNTKETRDIAICPKCKEKYIKELSTI